MGIEAQISAWVLMLVTSRSKRIEEVVSSPCLAFIEAFVEVDKII